MNTGNALLTTYYVGKVFKQKSNMKSSLFVAFFQSAFQISFLVFNTEELKFLFKM